MDINFKEFMGLKTPVKSKADHLLNEAFGKVLKMLPIDGLQSMKSNDFTISALVSANEMNHPEYNYFWEWMQEEGLPLLSQLDKRLPDTEKVMEFLTYRKMILEMDAANHSADMSFLSIMEFLTATAEFLSVYFETAATHGFHDEESVTLPTKRLLYTAIQWETMKSSAPLGAELLLYN